MRPGRRGGFRADAVRAGRAAGSRADHRGRRVRARDRRLVRPRGQGYRRIPVDEQCELLSLVGDVAEGQDGPIVHVHAVLGLSDGTTRGGHLLEGRVFPTLEAIVTETPAELRKILRPDIGIALIDLDRSES
ncbi:MAG TPA: DUF296 domain-containing protein [Streptosporangiaceae bacterium]